MNSDAISNNHCPARMLEYSDRLSAIAAHDRLRAFGAPPITMGQFYLSVLKRKLWTNQTKLSVDLRISKSMISRSVCAAQLPPEVIASFGNLKLISFRAAKAIALLIGEVGDKTVIKRALSVPKGSSAEDVMEILVTGNIPCRNTNNIRLSVGRNRRYIRLDSPNIDQIAAALPDIQAFIETFLPTLIRARK